LEGLGYKLAEAGSSRSVATARVSSVDLGKHPGRGKTMIECRQFELRIDDDVIFSRATPSVQSLEMQSDVGIRAVRDRNSSYGARCRGIVSSSGVIPMLPRSTFLLRNAATLR
jgi:hypothetical protein